VSSRWGSWVSIVAVLLLLASLVGCGDDDGGDGDGDDDKSDQAGKPVAGTFVGKVRTTDAFVSVVAAPVVKGQDKREITVFVCDAKRLCESFTGSASGNGFVAAAAGGEGEAKGKLSAKAATGSIELPDGKTVRYKAGQATATAGLYELTVSANGKIRGASASGVGLTGKSTLPEPGTGSLKLADGKRVKFDATENSADNPSGMRAGQVRLIVTPDYKLSGAGRSAGGGDVNFFIRSSSG
jgi:hypothetical protein